ncbi:MAG: lysylphosphatidylglycerol synthase domain-containing protein [Candidatus Rokuibacteriota bacterium]
MIALVERVLLVGGVVLFGILVYRLGAEAVLANLGVVGWGIVPIVFQEILALSANTAGWRAAFPSPRPPLSFPRLMITRLAGDAVNYLTPTATLGGEFVRTRMLRGYAPTTSVVASITVAKFTQTVGLLAFLLFGVVVIVDHSRLPEAVRWGLPLGLAILGGGLASLLVLQRWGFFGTILRWIEGWRLLRHLAHRLRPTVDELDREIAGTTRRGIVLSSTAFACGWALGTVESWIVLYFLGLPVTLERALTIEILGVAFNNLLFFVPLRAGTQEVGKVLAFTMVGLSPVQGLAAGILYRIRELFWACVGLVIFYLQRARTGTPTIAPGASRGGLC